MRTEEVASEPNPGRQLSSVRWRMGKGTGGAEPPSPGPVPWIARAGVLFHELRTSWSVTELMGGPRQHPDWAWRREDAWWRPSSQCLNSTEHCGRLRCYFEVYHSTSCFSDTGYLPKAATSVLPKVVEGGEAITAVPACRYWERRRGACGAWTADSDKWETRGPGGWVLPFLIALWKQPKGLITAEVGSTARPGGSCLLEWHEGEDQLRCFWSLTHVKINSLN